MSTQNPYFLSSGSHTTPAKGRCAMEWVAYLAGEEHSDRPACVSPVLRRYCITLNDRLRDKDRQKLRPYLARCIGTAGDGRDEERVALLGEWLLRTSVPRLLEECGRTQAAQRVRKLPLDLTLANVQRALRDALDEAYIARAQAWASLGRVVVDAADVAYYSVAAAVEVADAADVADVALALAEVAVAVSLPQALGEALPPRRERAVREAIELLERMLPTEIIQLPVVEDAAAVCALPAGEGLMPAPSPHSTEDQA